MNSMEFILTVVSSHVPFRSTNHQSGESSPRALSLNIREDRWQAKSIISIMLLSQYFNIGVVLEPKKARLYEFIGSPKKKFINSCIQTN